MQIVIDIPETQYNNIMEVKSMSLGRIPYKGIIMNAIRGIQNGTPIPDNATVCDIEQIRAEIEKPLLIERYADTESAKAQAIALSWCLEVIDKYTEGRT
jgi:hypothetical protein